MFEQFGSKLAKTVQYSLIFTLTFYGQQAHYMGTVCRIPWAKSRLGHCQGYLQE